MLVTEALSQSLKLLFQEIDKIKNIAELEECTKQIKHLLGQPPILQIIDVVEEQRKHKTERLITLEKYTIHDHEVLLNTVKQKTKDTVIDEDKVQSGSLRDTLKYLLKKQIQTPQHGLATLIFDDFIEKMVDELLHTTSCIAYNEENKKIQEISNFLHNITLIKHRKNIIKEAPEKLKIAIQNVCGFLVERISTTLSLRAFPIKAISFSFRNGNSPEESSIILKVNNEKPITIEGIRAHNLFLVLSNSWKELEIEDFYTKSTKNLSRQNDDLRKEFDAINRIIAKKWHEYGFVYGIYNLIDSEGYSHKINRNFAHFIPKNN